MSEHDAPAEMTLESYPSSGFVACPTCSGRRLFSLGASPAARTFAGKPLGDLDISQALFFCRDCGLRFKCPHLPESFYQRLYADTAPETWKSSQQRNDTKLVLQAVKELGIDEGDILDVGCFEGELLRKLPHKFNKFGTEASTSAATIAERHGVQILCSDFSRIKQIKQRFDVIVAVDVVEHTLNPAAFLDDLTGLLKAGGALIISTGDGNNACWRLAGNRYWYSAPAEHVSFISNQWLSDFARARSIKIAKRQSFRYYDKEIGSLWRKMFGFFVQALKFKFSDFIRRLFNYPARTNVWTIGEAGLFRDHLLATLKRTD